MAAVGPLTRVKSGDNCIAICPKLPHSAFCLIEPNSPNPLFLPLSLSLSGWVVVVVVVAVAMEAPRRTDSSGTSSGTSNEFPHREPMSTVRSASFPPACRFLYLFSPSVFCRALLFCFGCTSSTEISRSWLWLSFDFKPFRGEIRAGGFRFWCGFEFDRWF